MKTLALILILAITSVHNVYSQISMPGLGATKNATWVAAGLKEQLDDNDRWQSMTYVGIGIKNQHPLKISFGSPNLLVINQEFYHQFAKHFQYSVALSYRNQFETENTTSTLTLNHNTQQEIRAYNRFTYSQNLSSLQFSLTLRNELRYFIDNLPEPDFEDVQYRTRIKLQAKLPLDKQKQNTLTMGSEALFNTSRNKASHQWSPLAYSETRLSFFYTHTLKKSPISLSLGYMNNLIKVERQLKAISYVGFDITFTNLFKNLKR